MGFFDDYPYTNWHNVNLDWVLERVKEWGQMVEANNQAFQDLEEANASFKEYVTNYLQDLDVQAAIDDKLDRMFESGVLGEYLQPYVSPTVTAWLEENITEPLGVVIDSSLTVAGAAADALATGNRIEMIEDKVNSISSLDVSVKDALLYCFDNVLFYSGFNFHEYLENILYPEGRHYTLLNIDDIQSYRGMDSLYVDAFGNIDETGVKRFSIIQFNPSITRIKYYLDSYDLLNGFAWIIFRKVDNNTFYGTDGNLLFIFTWNSSTNVYNAVQDNTIATRTIITVPPGFKTKQDREIILKDGVLTIRNDTGSFIKITNSNIIGLWGDQNTETRGISYKNVRVYNDNV